MMVDPFDQIMAVVDEAEPLGSRRLATGVHLIGNVPHVAPEAYFHVVYPPLDDAQIASVEQEIGRPLPVELKTFYKHSNGMELFAYALTIDGMRHSYERTGDEAWQPSSIVTPNVTERPPEAPKSLVFFGFYRFDGSLLGMTSKSPEVYRFAPRSAKPLNVWPSFDDMLVSEVRRLSGLFDTKGQSLNKEMPTTP